jgi:hypothetical protein
MKIVGVELEKQIIKSCHFNLPQGAFAIKKNIAVVITFVK